MGIKTTSFKLQTKGKTDIIDITRDVQNAVNNSSFAEGNVLIFVPGSTAGITSIEYEPGLLKDYPDFFEKIIPSKNTYEHDNTWHDGNGYSHIRASLQGSSFTVPFVNRKLILGTWQQIILIDFDNRARSREVVVQIMGE